MSRENFKDPLRDPALKPPGLLESLAESLLGARRPLDCIQIEVSSYCPGKCVYCPHTTADHWQPRFLTDEIFVRLWPFLRRSARAHLQGWGEPLLHKRFFDYVAACRKAGCQVSSTTCGLNISVETAEKIANSGMDVLAVSLVGTNSEDNAPRAGIDFGRMADNVRRLTEIIRKKGLGPEIHIAYLLLADRMESAFRLPELMKDWGVSVAVVSTLDYLALPDHAELAFGPEQREKIDAARNILEEASARAKGAGLEIRYALPNASSAGGCRENVGRTVYVDAGGTISPCVYLNVPDADAQRRRNFGNVSEKDAWQLWRLPDFAAFRDQVENGACPAECADCPKRFEEEQI